MPMPLFSLRLIPGERCASAASASVPPSPLLSARMINVPYLIVTTTISAQKISDAEPMTARCPGSAPPAARTDSRIAYNGLVPMSPKTTPSAPSVSIIVRFSSGLAGRFAGAPAESPSCADLNAAEFAKLSFFTRCGSSAANVTQLFAAWVVALAHEGREIRPPCGKGNRAEANACAAENPNCRDSIPACHPVGCFVPVRPDKSTHRVYARAQRVVAQIPNAHFAPVIVRAHIDDRVIAIDSAVVQLVSVIDTNLT